MIAKIPQIRPWMLKKEIHILYYGLQDSRTSLLAKLPAFLSVIYLLSPIDIIPDFIPFLGYVDDLIIVPLLLNLSIRFLPGDVLRDSMFKAYKSQRRITVIIFLGVLLIISLIVGIFFLIRHLIYT